MSKPKKLITCSICKKNEYKERYGHRAEPVVNGTCCNKCNSKVVIPIRLLQLFGEKMDKIEIFAKQQIDIMENKDKALTKDDYKELVTLSADALQLAKESEVVLNQILKKKESK